MKAAISRVLLPGEIKVNEREASLRLGYPYDPEDPTNKMILRKLRSVVMPRYVWRESVLGVDGDLCSMEFAAVHSHSLAKNLNGCKCVYVIAATLGSGVDRMSAQLELYDPSQAFLFDALASAMTESLCDITEKRITGIRPHRPRYSPGYGDLGLEIQRPLLDFLGAGKALGITLTDSLFMKPAKTITALIGVESK